MRYDTETREAVLNLWPNYDAAQIVDLMAEKGVDIEVSNVRSIVATARNNHDTRAKVKTNAVYA